MASPGIRYAGVRETSLRRRQLGYQRTERYQRRPHQQFPPFRRALSAAKVYLIHPTNEQPPGPFDLVLSVPKRRISRALQPCLCEPHRAAPGNPCLEPARAHTQLQWCPDRTQTHRLPSIRKQATTTQPPRQSSCGHTHTHTQTHTSLTDRSARSEQAGRQARAAQGLIKHCGIVSKAPRCWVLLLQHCRVA